MGRRVLARAPTVRIGVLTNMTGPYRDETGPTFMACIHQAVEEASAAAPGINVEVLVADPQGKPDVGVSIVREWLDRDGVDMVVDASNSAIALAVNTVVRDKNKVYLNPGSDDAKPHSGTVQPEHNQMDLRQHHAREIHRQGDGAGGW